jgi:ABC-type multidrug transport system fused ATPase/permease subunit
MNNRKQVKLFYFELISRFKIRFSLLVLFGVLNSFLQGISIIMIIPLLQILEKKDSNTILVQFLKFLGWDGSMGFLLVFYFLILFSYAVFKSIYNYNAAKTVLYFSRTLSESTFTKVASAKWKFHQMYDKSKLVNLFTVEYHNLRQVILNSFRMIQALLLMIIELTISLIVSWKITLLTLFSLFLIYTFQRKMVSLNYSYGASRIPITQRIQKFLNENFSAIKLIKLHKFEKNRNDYFSEIQSELQVSELKTAKIDAIIEFVFIGSSALVIVMVIFVNFHFNILGISGLLIVLVLLSKVIEQAQYFIKVSGVFMNFLPSFMSFKSVNETVDCDYFNNEIGSKIQEKNIRSISFHDVHFAYNETEILSDLSYYFERGKLYLLFGPSGKGKTTTLDLIAGLIHPTKGSVVINNNGENILNGVVENLSYVLQDTLLFQGTIADNICIGGTFSQAEIINAIELSGLNSLVSKLPNGLDTILNEGSSVLSGGEKQRIALARALIRNSDIILLDEVTSSLDVANETSIMDVISSLKTNKIIIMVGHKESLKDYADEVIYFE